MKNSSHCQLVIFFLWQNSKLRFKFKYGFEEIRTIMKTGFFFWLYMTPIFQITSFSTNKNSPDELRSYFDFKERYFVKMRHQQKKFFFFFVNSLFSSTFPSSACGHEIRQLIFLFLLLFLFSFEERFRINVFFYLYENQSKVAYLICLWTLKE